MVLTNLNQKKNCRGSPPPALSLPMPDWPAAINKIQWAITDQLSGFGHFGVFVRFLDDLKISYILIPMVNPVYT